MKRLGRIWTVIVYIFLYAPMVILFIGSFNDGKDLSEFEGFTFDNYADLFRNSHLLGLLLNSLILAVCAAALATVLGTLAALGIQAMRGKLRRTVMTLTNIPLVNPEIVTGVSLALLFVFIGRKMLNTENILGFTTLLIAHVTFCLPYVILSVMPKLRQLDPSLMDAAQDLGCTPMQGFFKVVFPELLPGIVSGAIMSFTMSLDDFVISYFAYGPRFATLPVEIYTYTRKQVPPSLYAMFTLMFFLILIVMVVMNVIEARDERKQNKRIKTCESKGDKTDEKEGSIHRTCVRPCARDSRYERLREQQGRSERVQLGHEHRRGRGRIYRRHRAL